MPQDWVIAPDIGARIKDVRKRIFRMTQVAFADEVFRSEGSISDYERGKTVPEPIFLRQLAKRIGTSPGVFGDGGPMPSSIVNGPVNNPGRAELTQRDRNVVEAWGLLSEAVVRSSGILQGVAVGDQAAAPDERVLRSRAASGSRAAKKTRAVVLKKAREKKKKA